MRYSRGLRLFSFFFIVFLVSLLSSCGFFIEESISDHDTANQNMDLLIQSLENEDIDELKKLCSFNMKSTETFEDDVKELFEYYNGEYCSKYGNVHTVDYGNGVSLNYKLLDMWYDVETTSTTYRFAIHWYMDFNEDSKNIGIWSLYILKMEDDDFPTIGYSGDRLFTTGIHVATPHILRDDMDYLDLGVTDQDLANGKMRLLIRCLEANDKEGFKKLCAKAQMEQSTTYESDIDDLFTYYEGVYISKVGLVSTEQDLDEFPTFKKLNISYDVTTSIGTFRFCIGWCIRDNKIPDNSGIWYLYILKSEEDDYSEKWYEGDGTFTSGIHIDVHQNLDLIGREEGE